MDQNSLLAFFFVLYYRKMIIYSKTWKMWQDLFDLNNSDSCLSVYFSRLFLLCLTNSPNIFVVFFYQYKCHNTVFLKGGGGWGGVGCWGKHTFKIELNYTFHNTQIRKITQKFRQRDRLSRHSIWGRSTWEKPSWKFTYWGVVVGDARFEAFWDSGHYLCSL